LIGCSLERTESYWRKKEKYSGKKSEKRERDKSPGRLVWRESGRKEKRLLGQSWGIKERE
jgi:hypothetical protein